MWALKDGLGFASVLTIPAGAVLSMVFLLNYTSKHPLSIEMIAVSVLAVYGIAYFAAMAVTVVFYCLQALENGT